MRSAPPRITVSAVARNDTAAAPPPAPLPAAFNRRQWLAGAMLAVCAALIMLALTAGPYPRHLGQRLVLAAVVLAPVLLLRRWPLPVLAATTAANALLITTGVATLPFGIMLGVASYFAAARLPRRVSIRTAIISAAALGGALVYTTLTVPNAPVAGEAVESLLPLVAGWFTGDSVAARRRYLAGLAEQARNEQAAEAERARHQVREERVRIAREMHDVVAHTLAVITVQAGVGRRLMARRPEEASTALESIETIGRTAQEELRVVLGLLRDQENRTAALAPAPRLVDVKDLVETVRASGTPVDLHMSGADRPLSPALELTVYRVVQEALTNVVKHAPRAHATVDLAVCDHEIRLAVTDDGASQATGSRRAARSGPRHRRNARAHHRLRRPAHRRAPHRPGLPRDRPGPDRGRRVTTRVLVVDDQALLRTAFSSLIDAEDDLDVAGEAADGRQAVELAHSLAPDVVVMDVRMPVMDGIEATRLITADQSCSHPRPHPHHLRPGRVRLRGAPRRRERLRAQEPPAGGAADRDPHRRRRRGAPGPERDPPPHRPLRPGRAGRPRIPSAAWTSSPNASARCSSLVARGLSNAELAETLHVSLPTAKTHVSRILTKLGARDRTQLVVLAYESGLVTTP